MIDETLTTEEKPTEQEETATEETETPGVEKTEVKKEEEIDLSTLEPEVRGKKTEVKKEESPAEETELDPEDEKRISKIVDKRLSGMSEQLKEVQKLKDEAEVNGFLTARPELSKYKPAILKFMAHPAYANIPVHNIAAMLSSKEAEKIGAQKEREAAKAAKDTQAPGATSRKPAGSGTDWHVASKDEYEAQRAKVMGYQG